MVGTQAIKYIAKKAGKWAAKNIGSRAIGSAYNTVYKRLTHNRKP